MGYRLAADTMLTAHLLYIVFVVAGGLIALRARWILWLHVPAVLWAIYVQYFGQMCPLTAWENGFRTLAGEAGYEGGFIEHYLVPIIYPPGLTLPIHLVLGTAVVLVNAAVYAWILLRARAARQRLP